jgi:hypothetical protein
MKLVNTVGEFWMLVSMGGLHATGRDPRGQHMLQGVGDGQTSTLDS